MWYGSTRKLIWRLKLRPCDSMSFNSMPTCQLKSSIVPGSLRIFTHAAQWTPLDKQEKWAPEIKATAEDIWLRAVKLVVTVMADYRGSSACSHHPISSTAQTFILQHTSEQAPFLKQPSFRKWTLHWGGSCFWFLLFSN